MRYDASIKEWYLQLVKEQAPETTYITTKAYIARAQEWEDKFGKSLTDFTLSEITTMLRGFRFTSEASFYTVLSILTKYTEFACARLSKPTPQIKLVDTGNVNEIINTLAIDSKYVTREQLFSAIDKYKVTHEIYNEDSRADDVEGKIIMALLFEGIRGTDYQDLIRIKTEDVDLNKKRIYISSKEKYIDISDHRIWYLCLKNMNKKSILHFRKNGEVMEIPLNAESDIFLTRMVARRGRRSDKEDFNKYYTIQEFNSFSIKMRIKAISVGVELPYLTGVSIYVSGIAERAYQWLIENDRKLNHTSISEYLDLHDEKVGIAGVISAIENLYMV